MYGDCPRSPIRLKQWRMHIAYLRYFFLVTRSTRTYSSKVKSNHPPILPIIYPYIHPTIFFNYRVTNILQFIHRFKSVYQQKSTTQWSLTPSCLFITAMPRSGFQRIDWGKQENTERLLAAILAAQEMKVSLRKDFAPYWIVVLDIWIPISWHGPRTNRERKCYFSFLLFPLRLWYFLQPIETQKCEIGFHWLALIIFLSSDGLPSSSQNVRLR